LYKNGSLLVLYAMGETEKSQWAKSGKLGGRGGDESNHDSETKYGNIQ
jgi:hypothetical protein